MASTSLNNAGGQLALNVTGNAGVCGGTGSISLIITGGSAPYNVSWTGPTPGSLVANSNNVQLPNLGSGNYTITVASNGCSASIGGSVPAAAPGLDVTLTPISGNCGNDGQINVSITGGSAPYTINWSGTESGSTTINGTFVTIPNLSTGSYTVNVTSGSCTDSSTTPLNNNNGQISVNATGNAGVCGSNGSINLVVSGGSAPYTVNWTGPSSGSLSDNSSSIQIPNLTPGTYTVTVLSGGCTTTVASTVPTGSPALDVDLTPINGTCGSDGQINVTITGGAAPYTITWSGTESGTTTINGTFVTIPNLSTGTYSVNVTSGTCSDYAATQINNGGGQLNVTAHPTPGVCGNTGQIGLNINGGSGPYTITWTGADNGSQTTNSANPQFGNFAPGTYTFTVSSNGCSANVTTTLAPPSPDINLGASPINATCSTEGSIHLGYANVTFPATISWSGPESGTATVTGGNSYTIGNLSPGTYVISIMDANNCSDTEMATVNAAEDNVAIQTTINNGTCTTEGSITVQASGGDGTYVLTWNGPESGSANISMGAFTIPNLDAGNYVLMLSDGNGCDDQESVTLTNPENNLDVTLIPTNVSCSANGQINVSITGGSAPYTITWTGTEMGSTTVNSSNVVIPNLPQGSYTVSVVDNGGCAETLPTTIGNNGDQISVSATPITGFCGGLGFFNLNISGGNAPYQVSWTGPSPGNTTSTGGQQQISGLLAGTYTFTVTSGNCSSTITRVLGPPSSNIDITASQMPAVCGQGGSIHVSVANANGPVTINWSGPSSGSQVINGSTYTIGNLTGGSYTITATSGGCQDVTQITVGSNNSNISVTATPTHAVCNQNGSIHVYWTGGFAPYTITWSGAAMGTTTTNGNSFSLPSAAPGTYSFTISSGNCSGSATTTVNQANNNLSVTATPNNGTCLVNPNFVVDINGGTGPYTLNWQGPETGSTPVGTNGNFVVNVQTPGLYGFNVTDANGCTTTTFATVGNNDLDISLSTTPGQCGDNTTLTVTMTNGTGPYQITYTGAIEGAVVSQTTTFTINNLPGSFYTVTVQDATGCSATDNIQVVSGPSDLDVIHTVSNLGCGALNNIWMDFFNGQAPYTIEWYGPSAGQATSTQHYYDIEGLGSGAYVVIVTDATGCVNVQQVYVVNTVNNLQVTYTPINGSCGGLASIDLELDGGQPWYTIAWYRDGQPVSETDINASSYTIQNLTAGTYYVRITDDNECQQGEFVTVTASGNTLQVSTDIMAPGCNNNGSIVLDYNGGTAPYAISWVGPQNGNMVTSNTNFTIDNLPGGTYQVSVQDANGCSNNFPVMVPGTTMGNLAADFELVADGLTINLTNQSSNGFYQWSFGDGNIDYGEDITYTYETPGTYQICLTVSGSCGSDTHCETVTVSSDGSLAILDLGEGSGGMNSTISIPVTLHNVQQIISLSGTIQVVDGTVATIVGATNGIIAPQFNAVTGTFSYYNNTGDALNFVPGEALFYVDVLLTGNVGDNTVLTFANAPLAIEIGIMENGFPTVIPYTTNDGSASIIQTAALQGQLTTYWGDGIMDAEVTITGPGYNGSMMTTQTGGYHMPDLMPGMEYTVSANKDLNPGNGLSTYALFIGQRFLLGMNPPQITSPYQVIAGDANCNDAFTTLDLFLIQRLIIGAADEFNSCPSWVFVADDSDMPTDFDAYNVFPYSNTNSMMLMQEETANFVGVKVGDILGQASADNVSDGDSGRTPTGELPFVADNPSVSAGEEVTLYFTSEAFADIVSYQFAMQFPTSMVEFVDFTPATDPALQTVIIGDNEAAEGKLRVSWFSLSGHGYSADSETTLFALRFRALQDIDNWNNILRLDPGTMLPEAYNDFDEALDPALDFNSETTTNTDEAGVARIFALYQNTPNPVQEETLIRFYLPASGQVQFELRDAFGKLVQQRVQDYGAGEHSLLLDNLQLPAGVYYYSLRSGDDSATRKMLIVK
ncbi:MAG: PKD domain-containing protein [Bacteroidota bacterium]